MILILDAYNVIHAIPSLEKIVDQDLRKSRDALLKLCLDLQRSRGDVHRVIVVFDGSSRYRDLLQPAYPSVDVVFTETNEDADRRILEILDTLPRREPVTVVSNDNYVFNNARVYGARVISAEAFYAMAMAKAGGRGAKVQNPDEELPDRAAADITEAYKRHLGV